MDEWTIVSDPCRYLSSIMHGFAVIIPNLSYCIADFNSINLKFVFAVNRNVRL
jgi:hypothetical protein